MPFFGILGLREQTGGQGQKRRWPQSRHPTPRLHLPSSFASHATGHLCLRVHVPSAFEARILRLFPDSLMLRRCFPLQQAPQAQRFPGFRKPSHLCIDPLSRSPACAELSGAKSAEPPLRLLRQPGAGGGVLLQPLRLPTRGWQRELVIVMPLWTNIYSTRKRGMGYP